MSFINRAAFISGFQFCPPASAWEDGEFLVPGLIGDAEWNNFDKQLPEYEHSRVGDPVLLVQVRSLHYVCAPGQDCALPGVDRAPAALLPAHGEAAGGTPEGAAGRVGDHWAQALQADGPRARRRAVDAWHVSEFV